MEASAYYESLLRQGYSPEQAKQYALQYYPDFEPSLPEMNPIQNPPAIPTPMPLPSPLPGMPLVPQAMEQSDSQKKKVISIALAGILVIAGAVGIMYAFGVFSEGDADFVGQWVDDSGQIMSFDSNGTVVSYSWSQEDPYLYWPFNSSWTKSGDEVTTTYERTVTSGEFPYDEKSNAVMKMKIDGSVMFLAVVEGVLTEDHGDGEVYEYDLTENSAESCFAMVNKGRFDFSGDNWNEDAHDTWYSMVNSVDVPSWCDNEFKNEYSFSLQKDDSFFKLTLETSKWEKLRISELQFFISVNEGSEIECFYDGYDGVCTYIPQMGSDKVRPGNTISFGRAEAWDTDCSSGCDLYVRIVQNTGSDQVLIDELTVSNLVWD
ncbi:MAG: hypothetical protein VXV85_04900 [Candidatus Thermoplasmatota archaeon]|nr:hypothetical protein [Candidatus Thermoplasmatota archaeon]